LLMLRFVRGKHTIAICSSSHTLYERSNTSLGDHECRCYRPGWRTERGSPAAIRGCPRSYERSLSQLRPIRP
jgi:hypothetical protein